MPGFFKRNRRSYDFPMAERAAPAAPASAPGSPTASPRTSGSEPAPGQDGSAPAAGDDAIKMSEAMQPQLAAEEIAIPPPDPALHKKTRKDFCVCIGLLVLFTLLCMGGLFVLWTLVFQGEKNALLHARRTDANLKHGVYNKDPPSK